MHSRDMLDGLSETSSLNEVQAYIEKVIELRGFHRASVQETMLLLLEEAGELAKAIRKTATGMAVDEEKIGNYDTVETEAADVFIVLTTVCNQLKINLFEAFKEKEAENWARTWRFNGLTETTTRGSQ